MVSGLGSDDTVLFLVSGGGLVITGPSGTNVNDLSIIICG